MKKIYISLHLILILQTMRTNFFILFLSIAFLTSCGKEKTNKETDTTADFKTKNVDLTIEFKYAVEDEFKMYYTKYPNAPIDGSLLLTKKIMGSPDFQKVTFSFPHGDFPRVIRLDTGNNQESSSIEIKSITIMHGDNIIDKSDWVKTVNWSPNESLIQDENNPNLYKIVENNAKVKSPIFMSNVVLIEALNKYFKDK
jgi:hypothetical protein